jgi:hypothetical protein
MMSTSRHGKRVNLHSSLSSGSFFLPVHGFWSPWPETVRRKRGVTVLRKHVRTDENSSLRMSKLCHEDR